HGIWNDLPFGEPVLYLPRRNAAGASPGTEGTSGGIGAVNPLRLHRGLCSWPIRSGNNCVDLWALRSQGTHRISSCCVAGQKERLAAAAAEVSRAAVTAPAWFRHPFFTAKFLERV